MLKQSSALVIVTSLSACAAMPDVTYRYYQAKSVTAVSVTQSLQCVKDAASAASANAKGDKPAPANYVELDVANAMNAPVTAYSADYSQPTSSLHLPDIDGSLSDTDVPATFFEDGRLNSLNATTTGEAETILKSAISLGTSIAAAGVAMDAASFVKGQEPPPSPTTVLCRALSGWPNADKLQLTFTRNINVEPAAETVLAYETAHPPADKPKDAKCESAAGYVLQNYLPNPPPTSQPQPTFVLNDPDTYPDTTVSDIDLYNKVKAVLPRISMTVGDVHAVCRVGTFDATTTKNVVSLTLQDTESVRLDYYVTPIGAKFDDKDGSGHPSDKWGGSTVAVVPVKQSYYPLAVPEGKAFGNSKVALTLAGSGAVTALEYSKTNGAAGAMNVAGAALAAATPASSPVTPTSSTPDRDTSTHTAGGSQPNGGGTHP
ncbi:MAG TPA: hypothetical protein VFV07_05500 [Rhizomicrobium sp.]|nr:hypothetical protein [Rhizomicrobium sp.]